MATDTKGKAQAAEAVGAPDVKPAANAFSSGIKRVPAAWLPALLAAGALFIWWTVVRVDHEMRADMVQQVRVAAQAVNVARIQALSGTETDLQNPNYLQLKEQFAAIRAADPRCRFAYLLGRKANGPVFFFLDSEPANSKDCSPAGQIYTEAPADDYRVFDTKAEAVTGPVTDRWGTWVTALVPITTPTNGAIVAVLCMDIDARDWTWNVATKAALPVGLMLVLLIGATAFFSATRHVGASPKPVLRRLLPSMSAMVILLFAGMGCLLWHQYRQQMAKEIAINVDDVAGDLRVALEQQAASMAATLQPITADPAVQKALREGDADFLWATWRPVFEALNRENHLTHFYFFDTNRVCLLRVHKPEKRGDLIERFTAREAERTGKIATGINLGPLGTFTLRVVKPVFESGRLVGYVELGKEIEDVLQALQPRPGVQLAVVIRKDFLSRQSWETGMRMLGRDADWDRLPRSVMIYASQGRLPDAFAQWADQLAGEHAHDERDREIKFNGKDWRVAAMPLPDASGQEVGDLLILRDISGIQADFARLLVLGGTASGVLLALLLGFIYALLRRTDVRITAQQAALRASESQLRAILESADDGILAVDDKGKVVKANRKFAELWRIPPSLMAGGSDQAMLDFVLGQLSDPDAFLKKVQLLYQTDAVDADILAFKDGRVFERVSTPMMMDGAVAGRVWSFRDITGRKQAEEEKARLEGQLMQIHKMESVGRLAGGVAHDFNNMLGVILGHAELALAQVDPAQPLHDDLMEIRKTAERSADLTRQLLTFARKQTIAPRVLDLNATVADMLKMLQRLIGENIQLRWQPGADLWLVKMDSSQIDQILTNLCVNARHAITDVGKITIETGNSTLDEAYCAAHAGAVPGSYVRLTVSDTGCGMDKETLMHLFEPFFTTKDLGKGTGLGLATVYGAVKQNNGFIYTRSEPGKGTTFDIYLPRHDTGGVAEVQMQARAQPDARGTGTILLVEDEPSILRMATIILERQGYAVLVAGTPGEAIRLARQHAGEIHLLLTDVVMPEMNGKELANILLAIHPHIKHLFMSGYTADVIAQHGILDEGMHFIQKPFGIKELTAKVREALEGK